MASYLRKTLNYLGESIEEVILTGIIILNVIDFLGMLNPDWDYLKKIVSWTALGYLLYRASLTKLFFGVKKKFPDFLLVVSYFLLSIKNVLSVSLNSITNLAAKGAGFWANLHPVSGGNLAGSARVIDISSSLSNVDLRTVTSIPLGSAMDNLTRAVTYNAGFPLKPNEIFVRISNNVGSGLFYVEPRFIVHRWHNFLIDHMFNLQKYALAAGFVMLLALTIYFVARIRIRGPSLMNIIEEEGEPPKNLGKFAVRLAIIFLLLNFFYIAVFNLTLEWLGFAVDAPILMIAIFFYLLVWLKHHKRFSTESIIYKVGNFGQDFYMKFIELFQTRRGLLLGLSGMLVLHMLTDIGNFILPYVTGLYPPLYFQELGAGHSPIFSIGGLFGIGAASLYHADLSMVSGIGEYVKVTYLYAANVISILLIFAAPAVIWYAIFRKREVDVPGYVLAAFFGSFVCSIAAPAFSMGRINSPLLVGVDITTHSIINSLLYPATSVVAVSVIVFAASLAISYSERHKPKLIIAALLVSFYFFGRYIYYFFIDTGSYYVRIVAGNLNNGEYFLGFYLFIFLALTIIFYSGGFFSFIYEFVKG